MNTEEKTEIPIEFKSLNLLIEPKEKWIKLARPTSELINKILASAKSCEEDSLFDINYAEMAHKIVDEFIKTPIPSGI